MGSFANVVILRLPEGKSIATPRSQCPQCQSFIKWYDNIPVFSWFALKGLCRSCKSNISWRYPLVEFLMGVLFLAVYLRFSNFDLINWNVLEGLIFVFGLLTVSMIDFDHMILPDVFTLSGIVIGLLGSLFSIERTLLDSFLGVLFGGGFLWLIAYLYFVFKKEDGMGGGDIKLLAWIGAILGWQAIPFVILSSSLLGTIVGLALAIKTKGGLKTKIPFGPYLALGAVIFLLSGDFRNIYILQFFPWLEPS
ncbi:MAG: prepilin peptidase [Pseudomonadota bacterium]|nr:prepilin peptidase [Pseudomonadota bacterium]